MKKILILILSIFLLVSCGKQETVDDGEEDNDSDEETIVYVNNYDYIKTEPLSEYDESVDPNTSWNLNGDASYAREASKKVISINNSCELDNVSLTSNNLMIKNGTYSISFDVSVNKERTIELNIGEYLNEFINLNSGDNHFEYSFVNDGEIDYECVISFLLGGNADIIEINNLFLSSNNKVYGTRINQVGYLSNLEKQVVFTFNPGDYFGVYNSNDELVYVGDISTATYENDSDETLYRGYFGDVTDNGTYYIKSEFGNYSYEFNISNEVYTDLSSDALRFLYLQRCGSDIEDDLLGHPACHTSETKVWTYIKDEYFDASGGWHDAGDYGKYLVTTNKVIADLLFSYKYGDNQSEELLSEIRYGLDFVMKLQASNGSVYNKIVTQNFADFISPEYDDAQTYALYPWTLTTSSFAGITGIAYEVFKDIDEEYANKCLEAFNKAIDYLYNNQSAYNPINPDEFNVGTYYDEDESDERLFAYSVAYSITKDEKYLSLINDLFNNGIGGNLTANCKAYAYVTLLDSLDMESNLYQTVKDAFTAECDSAADSIKSNMYAYPMSTYMWGSNQHTCDTINELLLGARFLRDERYLKRASESIGYILGMNTLNMSFVYGYGYNYPSTIHSRLAYSKGVNTIKGALVNGVSQYLTDGIIGNYFDDNSPIATRFVDNSDSYSNVEPAINYNSALVLSLSLLDYANNNQLK